MPTYYTKQGKKIINPKAYASTGAPMYETKHCNTKNINAATTIYKLNLQNGKKYIGKTCNVDQRMEQHFSGNGSKVTKKFKPLNGEILDNVPGFFSSEVEHKYTKKNIKKHGYQHVRGGYYTNSKTLKYTPEKNKPYSNTNSFVCYSSYNDSYSHEEEYYSDD
jgi:hypothetical protein